MRIAALVALVIVALAGIGLLAYFLFLNRPPEIDPRFAHCYLPLGSNTSIGVDVAADAKSFKLNFGGGKSVNPAITPEVLREFNACISLALGGAKYDLEIIGQLTPLGEVLDHWRSSADASTSRLVADVRPPLDKIINNLLVMGRGERWLVAKNWCEDPTLSACLSCQPKEITEQTTSVQFSIKSGTSVTSTELGRAGPPTDNPNQPYLPWQDVRDGIRYGNICARP